MSVMLEKKQGVMVGICGAMVVGFPEQEERLLLCIGIFSVVMETGSGKGSSFVL